MLRDHKNYNELKKMSETVGVLTGRYFTLKEMGHEFGITKERVRQIIGNQGNRNSMFSKKNQLKVCPVCKKEFRKELKYCSTPCKWKGNDNILGIGVPRTEFTPEQSRAYQKACYEKNRAKKQASNEKWRKKVMHTPEYKEKKRVYHLAYYHRNKERIVA